MVDTRSQATNTNATDNNTAGYIKRHMARPRVYCTGYAEIRWISKPHNYPFQNPRREKRENSQMPVYGPGRRGQILVRTVNWCRLPADDHDEKA